MWICVSVLGIDTAAWGSGVSHIRLVRTVDRTPEPQPGWVLSIDRSMAVELTSEASVTACEAEFTTGAKMCTISIAPCMNLTYSTATDPEQKLLLRVHPLDCRKNQGPEQGWEVYANPPRNPEAATDGRLRRIGQIPLEAEPVNEGETQALGKE